MSDLREAAEMALKFIVVSSAKDKAWYTTEEFELVSALRQALAQPEQEQYVTKVVAMHEDGTYTTERIPLPKREWVGLTDEEIHEVVSKKWWDWEDAFDIEGFSRAIEAKLKEKNT